MKNNKIKNQGFRAFLSSSLALAMTASLCAPMVAEAQERTLLSSTNYISLDSTNIARTTSFSGADKESTKQVTVGEFAVILREMLGYDRVNYVTEQSSSWDYQQESIEMMKVLGVFTNETADEIVTREKASLAVVTALRSWLAPMLDYFFNVIKDNVDTFQDESAFSEEYRNAVYLLQYFGIVGGDLEGTFRPQAPIKLGELSYIYENILQASPHSNKIYTIDDFNELDVAELTDINLIGTFIGIFSDITHSADFVEVGETITWNTKEGIITSSASKDGEKSTLLMLMEWELSKYQDCFGVAQSEWGQNFDVSISVGEKDGNTPERNYIYTENEDLAYITGYPTNKDATEYAEDTGIYDYIMSFYPTDLDLHGDDSWEEWDVELANDLLKVSRIAVATMEEIPVGASVTWHSNASDGIYISAQDPSGSAGFLREITLTLGENGSELGGAITAWGQDEEVTFVVAITDQGVPFLYTTNKSVAYRLNIPTSADVNDMVLEDPRPPQKGEDGETMYDYYAFMEDGELFGDIFYTFIETTVTDDSVVEGDTLIWHSSTGTFEVNSAENSSLRNMFANVTIPAVKASLWNGASISMIVGVDENGQKFPYTDNQFFAFLGGIPQSNNSSDYVQQEDLSHLDLPFWFFDTVGTPGDWESAIVQTDATSANELVKICIISLAVTEETPIGAIVTWDSSGTGEVTVTGDDVGNFTKEIFMTLGDSFALGTAVSSSWQEEPFVLHVTKDENEIPFVYCENLEFAKILNLATDANRNYAWETTGTSDSITVTNPEITEEFPSDFATEEFYMELD